MTAGRAPAFHRDKSLQTQAGIRERFGGGDWNWIPRGLVAIAVASTAANIVVILALQPVIVLTFGWGGWLDLLPASLGAVVMAGWALHVWLKYWRTSK